MIESTVPSERRALGISGRPAFVVPVFRQQLRADDEEERHHRHVRAGRPSPTRNIPAADRPAPARCAPPAEKLEIQMPIAKVRSLVVEEHVADERERRGASVAAATPRQARAAIRSGTLWAKAARIEAPPKKAAPMRSSFRRPMRSPSTPIGMRRAGQHEAVDVDDPQQLRAAGFEIRGEMRHGEIEDREIHRIEQARQGQRRQGRSIPFASPLAIARGGGVCVRRHHRPFAARAYRA